MRDICFEGESGILSCVPYFIRDKYYNRSNCQIDWPNGHITKGYSAEEPKRLRGPQFHFAWCDEPASWKATKGNDGKLEHAWDMLAFALRLGTDPRAIVTGTPKPVALIKELLLDPNTYITRGSTYDNRANLAKTFFDKIIKKYENTRLGRQELMAELLDDMPGALWSLSLLDAFRYLYPNKPPAYRKVVVAIDPAATSEDDSNDTGIIGAAEGEDGHGYLLADVSCHEKPLGWARKAVELYHSIKADHIVAEVNNGGEMVVSNIKTVDPLVPVHVVHATRGKAVRAEPISSLYEQGKCHHVGLFKELEEQMTNFSLSGYGLRGSPDRMDAAVWAFYDLLIVGHTQQGVMDYYEEQARIANALKSKQGSGLGAFSGLTR